MQQERQHLRQQRQQQQPSPKPCIVRVLWPLGLTDYLTSEGASCLLLGAAMIARHAQGGSMLVAAVLGVCPADQCMQSAAAGQLQHAAAVQVESFQDTLEASLGVLGVWTASCVDLAAAAAAAAAGPAVFNAENTLRLAMYGSQCMVPALQLGRWSCGAKQQLWVPECSIQQSKLQDGRTEVQVFLYQVPAGAGHGSTLHAPQQQQQQQQQQGNLPWMIRDPAAITLASLLGMLQRAHSTIRHLQLQQSSSSSSNTQSSNQPALWQSQVLQQQQQLPAGGSSGWQQLNALLTWPHSQQQHSWLTLAFIKLHSSMQCWGSKWRRTQHSCSAAAAAAGQDADSSCTACSSSAVVLPGLLQHLLGLIAAAALLQYWNELLLHGAAAGGWLQQQLLQPHIDWLMQAHPGGIKLHYELSLLLGSAAGAALDLAAAFYASAWPFVGRAALAAVAAAAALGGAVAGCMVAADVLLLLLWPLVGVFVAAAALHKFQLRCLAATWRLIRGKEKVRRFSERWRQREQQQAAATAAAKASSAAPSSSGPAARQPAASQPPPPAAAAAGSDEVSVEQLIVGVLLFMPVLGLFPTAAAWYFSVCCCHGALLLVRLLLVGLGRLLRLRALQLLLSRWSEPQRFPGQLMVQPLAPLHGSGSTDFHAFEMPRSAPHHRDRGMTSRGAAGKAAAVNQAELSAAGASAGEQKEDGLLPVYYQLYCDPRSYADVLKSSLAQQAAGSSPQSASWGASVRCLFRAVVRGEVWGVSLYCKK